MARIEIENLHFEPMRDADRGLVEEKQARPAHQGAADRDHLLLAAGQRARLLAGAFAQYAEQGVYTLQIGGNLCAVVAQIGAELQILEHGQFRKQTPSFRTMTYAARHNLMHRQFADIGAIKSQITAARQSARDRFQQRRLAGAVGTEHGNELALAHFEIESLERERLTVVNGEARDFKQCHGRSP